MRDVRDLLWEADLLGLDVLTWAENEDGWRCTSSALKVPHLAAGRTMAEALDELVRFAWRVC